MKVKLAKLTNKLKTFLMGLGISLLSIAYGYAIGMNPNTTDVWYNLAVTLGFSIPIIFLIQRVDKYVKDD
jgi:hypothetical protein